jgi:hypothetical protein
VCGHSEAISENVNAGNLNGSDLDFNRTRTEPPKYEQAQTLQISGLRISDFEPTNREHKTVASAEGPPEGRKAW